MIVLCNAIVIIEYQHINPHVRASTRLHFHQRLSMCCDELSLYHTTKLQMGARAEISRAPHLLLCNAILSLFDVVAAGALRKVFTALLAVKAHRVLCAQSQS